MIILIPSDQMGSRSSTLMLREYPNYTSTCIDNFMHQNIDAQNNEVLQFQNISYHYPILLNWNVESGTKDITQTCRYLSFLKDPKCSKNYQKASKKCAKFAQAIQ